MAKKRSGAAVGPTAASGGGTWALFTNKGTWVLILSHAMFNLGRYTYEQEMPKYYSESLQEPNAVAGMHLASLHVTAVSASMFLKSRVDGFGLSVVSIRRIAAI